MKAKFLLLTICCLSTFLMSECYAKRSYSSPYSSPRYSTGFGKTHSVRPYFKKNGTFVQRHRAGNPRSGVHCQNNVCY